MVIKTNKKAIESYLEMAKKMTHIPIYNESIARCYHWLGEKEMARDWFIKTATLKKEQFNSSNFINNLSFFNKGNSYIFVANMYIKGSEKAVALPLIKKAIEYFLKDLQESPNNENAWGNIAECHFLLQEFNQVIIDLEELHKIRPRSYPRYDALGLLAKAKIERKKELALEALELIEKSIKSERLKPYYEGDTYSMWDRYEEAMEIIKELEG